MIYNITQLTIIEAGNPKGEEAIQTQTPQNITLHLPPDTFHPSSGLSSRALGIVQVPIRGPGHFPIRVSATRADH